MRLHLLLILLLVGFSFASDANYIITLKGSPKAHLAKALQSGNRSSGLHSLKNASSGKGRALEIQAMQTATLDSQKDIVRELRSRGVDVKRQLWLTNGLAVYVPPEKLAEIGSLPGVERISPNKKVYLMRESAGPVIGLPYAWNLGLNGSGFKIAIVDTGINKSHSELVGRVVNETDFATGGNPMDYYGHGTHVAGIAAGSLYGVARNVSILNAKVLDNSGSGTLTNVQLGMDWAVTQGADVISLSIGSDDNTDICEGDALADTVEAAVDMGVVVVVAAGNSGPISSDHPCRHAEDSSGNSYSICSPGCSKAAITVGATDDWDNIAGFSSRGPTQDGRIKPDLTAPGVGITSTSNTGGYVSMQGTSMATPFVSGAAILLLEKKPSLTPQMVKAVLMNSAKNLSGAGIDNTYGAGRLNISEAIRETAMVLEDTASAAQNKTYLISVSNVNNPLKATLYWSENWDVHSNLNLTLIAPNGSVFSNYNSNEVFEQAGVSQPQVGTWQLVVSSDTSRTFAIAANLAFNQNSFDISAAPQVYATTANSSVNFTSTLTNFLDLNDTYYFNASSSLNVTLSNWDLTLLPASSGNLTLSVLAPYGVFAGAYPVNFSAFSNYTNTSKSLLVYVNVFSNISARVTPIGITYRNLTYEFDANVTDYAGRPVTNAVANAILSEPAGATDNLSLNYSAGIYRANFTIPPNSSVGLWNVSVTSSALYYYSNLSLSDFLVYGRLNASIISNQTFIAGYAYPLNSSVADEVGNPVGANVSWYLNGTNFANGTSAAFYPGAQDVGNRTLSINATKQYYTEWLYSINVTITDPPPQISNLGVLPSHILLPNETMNVSALVTDNLNVSAVWANVTFPNASTGIFFLNGSGGYSALLNFSANGTYRLNLFANDSRGQASNLSDSFFVFKPVNVSFSLNATGILRILPQDYNETRNFTNASANMILPSAEYRLRLELGNATFQFSGVLLNADVAVNVSSQQTALPDNEVFVPVSAYGVSTTANFSSARVSFAYNSTVDPGKLSIFHCTEANYRNCTSITTQIDPASRIAYSDVRSFSIYSLGLNKTFSAGITSYPASVRSGDSVSVIVNVTLDGAPVSDANFSVSVGGTPVVLITKTLAGGLWTLSFTAPSLADGPMALAVSASYGARSAVDSRPIAYYTPAQTTYYPSGGSYYSAIAHSNASNPTSGGNKTAETAGNGTGQISLGITGLEENVSIYAGTERVVPVRVLNSGGRAFVTVSLADTDASFFFSDSGFVNSSEVRKFNILLKIPFGTAPGNYTLSAVALVDGKTQASKRFLLEILEKEKKAAGNESRLVVKASAITKTLRGEPPVIKLELVTGKPELVVASYLVKNAETGEVVSNYSEYLFVETSSTVTKQITVPGNLTEGVYVVEAVFAYGGNAAKDITTFEVLPKEPGKVPAKPNVQYAPMAAILAVIAMLAAYHVHKRPKPKQEGRLFFDPGQVPREGLYVGRTEAKPGKAYLNLNDLLLHMIAAGGTGSGKTVAVMDIVEEAVASGVKVLVFDPTAQWTGFPKPADGAMVEKHREFGLGEKDRRGYPANIIEVSGPEAVPGLNDLPAGLTVFDMHNLHVNDLDKFLENTINAIFGSGLPESSSLKYLVVYDEIHRSLPKYGGKRSYRALERGCREFRKWGIGIIMLSQVLSDFRGAIRANIGTELQMRTKYEADIGRMRSKYGAEYAHQLTKLKVGEGIIQNPEYNAGKPYLVQFRPLRHSDGRASAEELKKYAELMGRADVVDKKIAGMKDNRSVGLEVELAREKTRLFLFRIAETYLDSAEEKLASMQKG